MSLKPVGENPARRSVHLPCPSVPLPARFAALPVLSRTDIAACISQGELIVLHLPLVYKIPKNWLKIHPGGDLAILHFVGRDASNEIEGYHAGLTVLEKMGRWVIGKVEEKVDDGISDAGEGWRDMVPPVQLGLWPVVPLPVAETEGVETKDEKSLDIEEIARQKGFVPTRLIDPPLAASELLPLTPSYQNHLRKSLRRLHAKMHDADLMSTPPILSGYAPSLLIYASLFLSFLYFYIHAQGILGYLAAAVSLGGFWHQITFVAHDAGHTGLTGHWYQDRVLGIFIADFVGGISIGWWCDNHNVHHLVTNSPEHDPDIQHLPFFAISPKFFAGLTSTYYKRVMVFDKFSQFVLPYQHKLYYIIMCFARFNLFANSYIFMCTKWPVKSSPLYKLRLLEFVGIASFWTWFGLVVNGVHGVGNKIAFVLVSFAVTSPLHVQIVLSHFSQSVSVSSEIVPHTELIESFAHRQLRTTMDISTPTYLDFLHGGLNFQVPHHLFPRMPRFRFRAAADLLKTWVEEEQALVKEMGWELKEGEGLRYKKMEFVEANRDVLGVLKNVATQVRFMAVVAEADAKGEIEH